MKHSSQNIGKRNPVWGSPGERNLGAEEPSMCCQSHTHTRVLPCTHMDIHALPHTCTPPAHMPLAHLSGSGRLPGAVLLLSEKLAFPSSS